MMPWKLVGCSHEVETPVTLSVVPEIDDLAANVSAPELEYRMPNLKAHCAVWISVDVSGPVSINKISVVPKDNRSMAGYVAGHCERHGGLVGFVQGGFRDSWTWSPI